MSDENHILQDMADLGCPGVEESRVILQSRITSIQYKVRVDGHLYHERKAPCASAGSRGENPFVDFVAEIRRLHRLRSVPAVVQLKGVVLDDTREHIKGYLYEAPKIFNLRALLALANRLKKSIPWAIRANWMRQIIAGMADVHARDCVVGGLGLSRVGLRADGTIVLDLTDSHRFLDAAPDSVIPEIGESLDLGSPRLLSSMMNFKTDVYQLGMLLWLIAEHQHQSSPYHCIRVRCTKVPLYQCTADHSSPTNLYCSAWVPSYVSEIIRLCRLSDPRLRPTARNLLKHFPTVANEVDKACLDGLFTDFFGLPTVKNYRCSECGFWMIVEKTDTVFHCHICDEDDFDLCIDCVAKGIHCWDPQHRLVKRGVR